MALLFAGPGAPRSRSWFLPMRFPRDVLVAAGSVGMAPAGGHEPAAHVAAWRRQRSRSRGENMDPLPSKGLRSAEPNRRMRNIDLLVAWALIACQPFRCWLIPCCYM